MGSPGKSGRKQRKEVSRKPMKRRISNRQGNKTILSSFFLFFSATRSNFFIQYNEEKIHRFSLANRKGPAQNICTTARTPQSKQRIHMERLFSVKRFEDSAYQKVAGKIAALRLARGLLRKAVPARQERQNFGDSARQSVRHPSCTVYKLFPVCENKNNAGCIPTCGH